MKRFAEITKVEDNEDGTIDVFGVASNEDVDTQGETVTKGAMLDSFPEYFKHGGTGPLRAMHQPIAAGYVYKADVNDAGETEICAKVVDPVEITKVKTGVYKGFSIGGKKLPGGYDPKTKVISKMRLTEISLVDRPANPAATITMWKGEDIGGVEDESGEQIIDVSKELAEDIGALVDLMNKGDIAPDRVLELATADIAKAKDDKEKAGKKPYGDVEYADEKNNKYPLDTEKHIRAAYSYISMPKNQKDYSDAELEKVRAKIIAAWKDKIDKDGPPSADDTEKFDAADDLRKSMYSLQSFANVISSISCLACDAEYEAAYEGDGSAMPQNLRDWLKTGVELFKDMATEETAELLASLEPKTKITPTTDIAMSAVVGDISKALTGDAATVQSFIAAASPFVPAADISKALFDDAGQIGDNMRKLADAVIARVPESAADVFKKLADMESSFKKVQDECDIAKARVAELEKLPAPAKIALRVTAIGKGQDIITDEPATPEDDGIVKRADGSVDGEATAKNQILKIHQSGGQRALR